MPSKYIVRSFEENGYYHIFNRGVEKRKIFLDDKDYNMFLFYLSVYLNLLEKVLLKYPQLPLRLHARNLSSEIDLIAYCLMPNHFHLLLRQSTKDGISKFMKQITNAYTEYFNKRYKRTGSLMQGSFKAAKITTDELLVHISRYIHLNPIISGTVENLEDYKWSSLGTYAGLNKDELCQKSIILDVFGSHNNYLKFVKDQVNYSKQLKKLEGLAIEEL